MSFLNLFQQGVQLLLEALQLVRPEAIQQAYEMGQAALEVMQPPGFSFSEGATVGSWELLARRGAAP